MANADFIRRAARLLGRVLEIVILSSLILGTRCANYQEVFVQGHVAFTDADCYARMTRVRMCADHPGLIIRHHDFENYPQGTTPHTTAPFDYVILGLSLVLRSFTALPLDLAGALVSPLLALLGGWFLWWWSRKMGMRFRWALLILYAVSPILVHGTELGRPDHQSMLLLLLTLALCAEWSLRSQPSKGWGVISGLAWGAAIWVSAYESTLLLAVVFIVMLIRERPQFFSETRRAGWISFAIVLALALAVERRLPNFPLFNAEPVLRNWLLTIGELRPVRPWNPIWFRWCGWLLLAAPFLIWWNHRQRREKDGASADSPAVLITVLLAATYLLTVWQARWAYFFTLLFALALPAWLKECKRPALVWVIFALSLFPMLRDWDERLWPNEWEIARRMEWRTESVQLRELAVTMQSAERRAFLAPWWLSPALAYWSGQPGVAGSSHESISGIADTARFYQSVDSQKMLKILENHKVEWVLGYDAGRTAENCGALLGEFTPEHALCYVLDRAPAQAPKFLAFVAQNSGGKLFRIANNR